MPALLNLPPEILFDVILQLPSLRDVASFAQTASFPANLIYGPASETSLWRELYLCHFDDPRKTGWALHGPDAFDIQPIAWRKEAQRTVHALEDWTKGKLVTMVSNQKRATASVESLARLLFTASTSPLPSLNVLLLSAGPLPIEPLAFPRSLNEPTHRLLFALSIHLNSPCQHFTEDTLAPAREVAYSHRLSRGPFDPVTGMVDWEGLYCLWLIMTENVRRARREDVMWRQNAGEMPWAADEDVRPTGLPREIWTSTDEKLWDWAGIGGEWAGTYAFIDQHDYIAFNLGGADRPSLRGYEEAIGDVMALSLVPKPTMRPSKIARTPPPIPFVGHASNPGAMVHGTVRLTPDDPPQVRVMMVIAYGGADRWRLEGVIVGGVQPRGRGFFGTWGECEPMRHSPSGPFYYWKKG